MSATRSGWPASLSSLASSQFRWLFTSNLAFFLAMQGQALVRSVIVYQLTDSKLALGTVSAATAVAMLIGAPFGGVMADRLERRGLIIAAQSAAVVCEVAFFVLLIRGDLVFWQMVVLAGTMGFSFPLMMPARQAIVVNLVGRRGLGNAMALNMAGMNVMRVVGPAAAGFMIAIAGVETTYAVNLFLYAVALLSLLGVHRVPPAESARDASALTDLRDGVRYVRNNRIVLVMLIYGLVPMFLAMPFQTLLVVFAEDVWQTGSSGLGLLNAAAGFGGIAGSFYVAWRGDGHSRLHLMMASVTAFGLLLFGFSLSPWFYPALALCFGANVYASIFQTLNNTAIQLLISDDVRGRISSFLMMSFSLPLLGTLPLSAVAERFGAPIAVAGASFTAVAVAGIFYLVSPALRSLDEQVREAVARP